MNESVPKPNIHSPEHTENEQAYTQLVSEAKTLDEFVSTIEQIGDITDQSGNEYKAALLMKWAAISSDPDRDYDDIPEIYGLRRKYQELLLEQESPADKERRKQVTNATTLEELCEILRQFSYVGKESESGIIGNSASSVIALIERVRLGERNINYVPRAHGLRKKVAQLLVQE